MANIKVNVAGCEMEIDIPNDDDVQEYLRRECMLEACADLRQQLGFGEIAYDARRAFALRALVAAIKAHFPTVPVVKLTEA